MIKDLEQLAVKYQKIAELSLQLKQENSMLYKQIDNLQEQLTLLIEDKLKLEQRNNFLATQLKNAKQNLLSIIDNVYWEDPADFSVVSKETGSLYPSNSNLSFAAAAAAAAIGIDDMNMSAVILEENNSNNSELSKAVSELENIQEQISITLQGDISKLVSQNNDNQNINEDKDENHNTSSTQSSSKDFTEKMHYGMIKTNINNTNE